MSIFGILYITYWLPKFSGYNRPVHCFTERQLASATSDEAKCKLSLYYVEIYIFRDPGEKCLGS